MFYSATFYLMATAALSQSDIPPIPSPTPSPALSELASKTKAVGTLNEMRWMRQIHNNYPPQALREEWEGTVGVNVIVGTNGRVENCSVLLSSGYQVLDEAACKGMLRYARFYPALDARGAAIRATFRTSIVYRLS